MRILVVEDEIELAESLRDGLVAEGYTVEVAHNGLVGRDRALTGAFDVVVLDIMLPGRNGYRVCADLREGGCQTPILMLTAKDGEFDEAEALDTGADDFLAKPFSFVVLLARLRALLRRTAGGVGASAGATGRHAVADIVVDRGQRRVWRNDTELHLTAREFDVLAELAVASPNIVSKTELLERVWGSRFEGDPNVVEVYVGYVRKKLDVAFTRNSLQTVRGHGYRLLDDRPL
jgi:DNA-binding response OmpR family regulator